MAFPRIYRVHSIADDSAILFSSPDKQIAIAKAKELDTNEKPTCVTMCQFVCHGDGSIL